MMNKLILPVHLPLPPGTINPRNYSNRAYPLKEMNRKVIDLAGIRKKADRIMAIHEVIDWLDVEHSPRYTPAGGFTYCNIYAYDLAYYLGCYLPRVWWHNDSLNRMLQEEQAEIIYGKTVFEQNCNALFNWFENFGRMFSWQQFKDPMEMPAAVNKGALGIIVAQRREASLSGHITAVIPEQISGKGRFPLQSQAGAANKKYYREDWWNDTDKFIRFSGWVHNS